MNGYAHTAVEAANELQAKTIQPAQAWARAAKVMFPNSLEAQKKGCPKNAFLGLCSAGRIKNVPSGEYTTSLKNKTYAIKASEILRDDPTLAQDPNELWKKTLLELDEDKSKTHNQQMHVVVALHLRNFIT